uniref:RRM domain-containing protein n=1 Tax=Pyrodinium bahamense TaxID=73915 RepID=A0A7S0FG26_9DINO
MGHHGESSALQLASAKPLAVPALVVATPPAVAQPFSLKEELGRFWTRCAEAWPEPKRRRECSPSEGEEGAASPAPSPARSPSPSPEPAAHSPGRGGNGRACLRSRSAGKTGGGRSEDEDGAASPVPSPARSPSHAPGPAARSSGRGWSTPPLRGGVSTGGGKRGRTPALRSKRASRAAVGTSGCRQSNRHHRSGGDACSRSRSAGKNGRGRSEDAQEAVKPARKGNWDVLPDLTEIIAQQKISHLAYPKKRRECYCGNLAAGQVTQAVLWQALNRLFNAVPMFHECYPDVSDPIRNMAFPTGQGGMFAFVEFFDEIIANTALHFSGFELCGRPVKVGRPQGYVPAPYGELPPLDVEPLRQRGLLPMAPEVVIPTVKTTVANKLRELYFGNLLTGKVTESIMTEFLTPACSQLPEYNPSSGPPISKVTVANSGTYCFVQFQSADMASRVMAIFDDIEFLGRRLRVGRPTNYHLNFQGSAAQALTDLAPPPVPPPQPPSAQKEAVGPSEAFLAGAAAVSGLSL